MVAKGRGGDLDKADERRSALALKFQAKACKGKPELQMQFTQHNVNNTIDKACEIATCKKIICHGHILGIMHIWDIPISSILGTVQSCQRLTGNCHL